MELFSKNDGLRALNAIVELPSIFKNGAV